MAGPVPTHIVRELMAVIQSRKVNPPPRSYTSSLFAGGLEKIGGKVLEEAQELVEAATEKGQAGRDHVVQESADVVYHLLVLLAHCGCNWSDVEAALAARFGISGLDEKESRTS